MTRDACQGEVSAGKLPEGAGVFSYRGDDEHGRMSYDGDWSNKARASNEPSRRLREEDELRPLNRDCKSVIFGNLRLKL